jgi:hypothetical protein
MTNLGAAWDSRFPSAPLRAGSHPAFSRVRNDKRLCVGKTVIRRLGREGGTGEGIPSIPAWVSQARRSSFALSLVKPSEIKAGKL